MKTVKDASDYDHLSRFGVQGSFVDLPLPLVVEGQDSNGMAILKTGDLHKSRLSY